MSILSKEKRRIYARKIKGFWEEFRGHRIGLLGLAILILYLAVAILTPYLTPYRPDTSYYKPPKLAGRFAMPGWMTSFPQSSDLPPTIKLSFLDMDILQKSTNISVEWQPGEKPTFVFDVSGRETAEVLLGLDFSYPYAPPNEFEVRIGYTAEPINYTTYSFQVILKNTTSNEQWEEYLEDPTQVTIGYFTASVPKQSGVGWEASELIKKELFSWKYPTDPSKWLTLKTANILLSEKAEYSLQLKITFESRPPHEGSIGIVRLTSGELTIFGSVHGILGSNMFGYDVYTELIYGVAISLLVGTLAAVISTALGILWGVISGYLGGILDEAMMRTVDVLLCLPVLPILLIMIQFFEPSVYHVVVLIAIFGWQALSRIIRSRVLSLREMPFIESARAAGASKAYIMIRHILPNVVPVAMAAMVLAVPGAILTEAALSFLGFGDPDVPTWGRMLYRAQSEGAFPALAWWYIIPPGLAITTLCLAFVFIGHAVDEIVNPRLRRRR